MTLHEPLTSSAVHITIDMQRLFAEPTPWHTPALAAILPNVLRLASAKREQTLFARFRVPRTPGEATGRWQRYFARWSMLTGAVLDPALLDLVAPLAALATPESLVDKTSYSIFGSPGFAGRLADRGIDTLVFTGVETDVCVLASLLDAVDLGFRVIAVSDALASASAAAHDLALTHLFPRLPEQIEIADTDAVLAAW